MAFFTTVPETLAAYEHWLARQPLSAHTRRTYLTQVRRYCTYLSTFHWEYLSRGAIVHPQNAGAPLQLQMLMHVRPGEAVTIDRLVGIGGDKDAIGCITKAYEQAQCTGIEVLRLVYDHCIIPQPNKTSGYIFLSFRPGLPPRLLPL